MHFECFFLLLVFNELFYNSIAFSKHVFAVVFVHRVGKGFIVHDEMLIVLPLVHLNYVVMERVFKPVMP